MTQSALVIGGGVSGMNTTIDLAAQGFKTYLIEEKDTLGGHALELRRTWKGEEILQYIDKLRSQVLANGKIEVLTGARVSAVKGFVGQFSTTVQVKGAAREIEHGVAILATGGRFTQTQRIPVWAK